MKFRTAYDGKRVDASDVKFTDPGMTRQAHKDECDINNIMGQYMKSGLISHVREYEGQYGEFEEMDFHEAMNTVIAAQEMFETVPSEIRERFGNDPGAFINFVTDRNNEAGMRELGLLPAKRAEPPSDPAPEGPGAATPPDAPAEG